MIRSFLFCLTRHYSSHRSRGLYKLCYIFYDWFLILIHYVNILQSRECPIACSSIILKLCSDFDKDPGRQASNFGKEWMLLLSGLQDIFSVGGCFLNDLWMMDVGNANVIYIFATFELTKSNYYVLMNDFYY